jgi:hypothetical protein
MAFLLPFVFPFIFGTSVIAGSIVGGENACNQQADIDAKTADMQAKLAAYIAKSQSAYADLTSLDATVQSEINELLIGLGDSAADLQQQKKTYAQNFVMTEYIIIFIIVAVAFLLMMKRYKLLTMNPV